MSVISFRTSVLAGATNTIQLELGRSFIHAITLSTLSAVALTAEQQVRVFSKGSTVAPMLARGGENFIYVSSDNPIRLELKRELNGPPYELEIQVTNPTAGTVVTSGLIEVYNSPYPQTRLYITPGKEGENPFSALYAGVTQAQEKSKDQEKRKEK